MTRPPITPALLASMANSPEMQALIRAQAERDNEAAKAARADSLARLQVLREQEAAALQAMEAAAQSLRTAEEALTRKRETLAGLNNAYNDLISLRGHVQRELSRSHGEAVVTQALYHVDQLHREALQRLAYREGAQYLEYRAKDGTVLSRRKNPEMVKPLAESKAEVTRLAAALPKLQALVEAPLSPAELGAQVAGILAEAGVRAPGHEAVDDVAA